jgi:RNA polymerase sigma-70 factor (ECF subfamily)
MMVNRSVHPEGCQRTRTAGDQKREQMDNATETFSGDPRIQGVDTVPGGQAPLTDEELVSRVLAGEQDLFEVLVVRHQRRIVRYLARMVHDPDQAEELAQVTFVKAFTRLASFDPAYRFTTWLYRIASNAAIDHFRRRRFTPLSLDRPLDPGGEGRMGMQFPSPAPGPEELALRGETGALLRAAVDRLPAEYRQLIALRHGAECSYGEIAEITGLPMGTVKNRLFRARNKLHQLLSGSALDRRPEGRPVESVV